MVKTLKEIIKCTQYDLMRAKAKLGQMYFVTDSRLLYKDNGENTEQRLIFNAVVLHSEYERQHSIKPVIGKFYYVEETNCLWLFDTRWVLKIGNNTSYNSYYAGEYVSPVINMDNTITGANGDSIIDNNGLLGDGSVAVRDINRIIRGVTKSNLPYNRLEMKSYLDDGMLIIPNAHLPYNDLSTSLGALHLTVERKDTNTGMELDLNGCAHYYGNWNNYGDMYLVQKDNNVGVYADYVPINDYEIVKYYIKCTKKSNEDTITTHIIIRPISDSVAIAHVLSIYGENSNSVVQNDMGELIFTNHGDVVDDNVVECKRRIINDGDSRISQYILDAYNEEIVIKQEKDSLLMSVEIGETWTDESDNAVISVSKWTKDKILTQHELEKEINNLNKPESINPSLPELETVLGQYVDNWFESHPEAITNVPDGSLTLKKFAINKLSFLTPELFGAIGDGVTDDTTALKNMVAYGKENNITTFIFSNQKTYLVSLPIIEITDSWGKNSQNNRKIFKIIDVDFDNAVFNLNNSKIKVAPNMYPYYSVFYVSANNCKILNGVIEGDKNEHDYETFIYREEGKVGTHEFGFGIEHYDGINLIVDNMDIFNTTGDAIIVGGKSGICITTIKNCNLHHCRRQGISMLDSDKIYVYDTKIHHIGTSDGTYGTSPMAGIDIEPNNDTKILNYCYMRNVSIEQCSECAIIAGGNVLKVDLYNCNFEGTVNVGLDVFNFNNCNFIFDSNSLKRKTAYGLNGYYVNCKFNFLDTSRDIYVTLPGDYQNCNFHGRIDDNNKSIALLTRSNCCINNCNFFDIVGNNYTIIPGEFYDNGEPKRVEYKGLVIDYLIDGIQPINNSYFHNSNLTLRQWHDDFVLSNCIFEKAYLLITNVKKCKVNSCTFKEGKCWVPDDGMLEMNNCYFTNSVLNEFGGKAYKIIRNSYIELNSLPSNCFTKSGLICNSTLKFHSDFNIDYLGNKAKCYNSQIDSVYITQEDLSKYSNLVNTYVVSTEKN